MIVGSKKGTSFLCQNVVNKDRTKNCLQEGVVGGLKKVREKHFSFPRPLQENIGPSLMVNVC